MGSHHGRKRERTLRAEASRIDGAKLMMLKRIMNRATLMKNQRLTRGRLMIAVLDIVVSHG